MTDTTTTTVASLAGEAYSWFETAKRGEGEEATRFVRLKDGRPEWVYELVQQAHADFFPDDFRYASIMSACEAIHESDGDEDAAEWADTNVDVYTSARYEWLASNLQRAGYCDDARDEGLVPEDADMVDRIGVGQYMELSEIYGLVYRALEDRLEALGDDEPAAEDIAPVFQAYLECALWSSTDAEGKPLDDLYGIGDFSDESLASMRADVTDFLGLLERENVDVSEIPPSQLGHDFWLTRNGHGAGFWDRGLGDLGDELTKWAKTYGESDIYVGDDGRLWVSP